jgi:signal transduction histidine kinase/class 3 adenylate cyclase
MSDEHGPEPLEREVAYYKDRVDELSGENLKLDYTISGLRHEVKQKRQGFALVAELQQAVGAERQISAIFDTVIHAINSALGMDRTLVLSPTAEEHRFRPAHLLGFRQDVVESVTTRVFTFPPEFQEGAGLLVVNKATVPTPLVEELREALDLPFFIAVPVMGEQRPIGILLSGRLKESLPLYPPLDQGDVDTFQAIAGLITTSVQNMRVAVLEEMDRLKTDFFANISHEFRTPITLTIGPLEQVLSGRHGAVSDAVRDRLVMMRRNQERLLALVNQILDLAKMEAGGMELKAVPVRDVNAVIRQAVEQFRATIEKQGIALRENLDPRAAHAELYLDREKFDRLVFNLLSNAVKFTRRGFIEVATQVQDYAFRISVTDSGVGIKEDQIPHIFDRFRQADGSESREYAGTGIGLALVQEVAKLHGGSVDVYSQYGKGTTFRVTVPLGSSHLSPSSVVDVLDADVTDSGNPPESSSTDVVLEGATDREGAGALNARSREAFDSDRPTVVYAEDNPDLRRHVYDLLGSDFNLFLAVDGREGLAMVRDYRPELLITDQMMPNMSGRELLAAVRADPEIEHTPVIFLTARVGTEARVSSLEAGADDYLTKPFHEAELLARVRNLIRAREQERSLATLNRRLEARIEEQMAELVRSGDLRRFISPSVAESVLRGDLAGNEAFERRRITVLVAELAGLDEALEGLEPEDTSGVVNDTVRELTSVAIARGGTVETGTGHGFTILFGTPVAAEPHEQAWKAVDTALALRVRLGDLVAQWRRKGVPGGIGVRQGVSTGYCTVGAFGGEILRAYGAVGTPVTVARELKSEAGPGEILVALTTHSLVENKVTSAPRGSYDLRGVARPVEVFEVLDALRERETSDRTPGPGPGFLPG